MRQCLNFYSISELTMDFRPKIISQISRKRLAWILLFFCFASIFGVSCCSNYCLSSILSTGIRVGTYLHLELHNEQILLWNVTLWYLITLLAPRPLPELNVGYRLPKLTVGNLHHSLWFLWFRKRESTTAGRSLTRRTVVYRELIQRRLKEITQTSKTTSSIMSQYVQH